MIKCGAFTNSSVLISEKITENISDNFLTTFESVKIKNYENLIFNVENEVLPKLLKSSEFTNSYVLITGNITEKISDNFLTTFKGVKIDYSSIFNVKNEVLPKLLKSIGFTNSYVLITEKITEKISDNFLTTF